MRWRTRLRISSGAVFVFLFDCMVRRTDGEEAHEPFLGGIGFIFKSVASYLNDLGCTQVVDLPGQSGNLNLPNTGWTRRS
jgi:hypothetical protein